MDGPNANKLTRFVADKYGLGEEWAALPPGASGDDPDWIERAVGDWPQPEPGAAGGVADAPISEAIQRALAGVGWLR